jgi:succinoglycan biosynthesis transport protein ExoP
VELDQLLKLLWQRRREIAVTFVVTMLVVVAGTALTRPTYIATATVRVVTARSGSAEWVNYDVMYADRLMNTYVQLVTSGPPAEEVRDRLGGSLEVSAELVPDTELIRISAQSEDPARATELANALADGLVAYSQQQSPEEGIAILERQTAQAEQELARLREELATLAERSPEGSDEVTAAQRAVESQENIYLTLVELSEEARVRDATLATFVTVVDHATAPDAPSGPRWPVNLAVGMLLGLGGGVGLGLLLHSLDPRIYSAAQAEALLSGSIVGAIPAATARQGVTLFAEGSAQRDALQRLGALLAARDQAAPLRSLLVTSAEPAAGKTTLVANLAAALARTHRRVVVVDGDLRQPALHSAFGLANTSGLSSALQGTGDSDVRLQAGPNPGVSILTAGPAVTDPVELLSAPRLASLIRELAQEGTLVLIDGPALLTRADSALIAPHVDGALLVVARGRSRQADLAAAAQQLRQLGTPVVGVIINYSAGPRRALFHWPMSFSPRGRREAAQIFEPGGKRYDAEKTP